jgi:lipoate-protein ligase A
VLHGGDLSYALIWPAAPGPRASVYGRCCGWLCRAFSDLGLPLQPGQSAPSRDRSSCFATSTSADLIHADGSKRIGSAQLWRGGCLLQHGSILITPQAELWERIFGEEPPLLPALPLGFDDLEALLLRSAARCLPLDCGGVSLVLRDLTPEEWTGVAAKALRQLHLTGSQHRTDHLGQGQSQWVTILLPSRGQQLAGEAEADLLEHGLSDLGAFQSS